jgi:MYXO-CTERM domain-containing protein
MRRSARGTTALVIAALTATGSAWGGFGDLGGTQPNTLLNGGQFTDADGCATCHGEGFMGDTTFLPFDTLAGTMMANSARDPVFKAALAIANQDGSPQVAEHCLRCHSPIGYVRGHTTPTDGSAFDVIDLQGVGCETCHRAVQTPLPEGPYLRGDAQIVYDDDPGKRGKYPGGFSVGHEAITDTGVNEPRFCGQCHDVTNPGLTLRDALGMDTGVDFPEQTTFREWESSAYAVAGGPSEAGCVTCHMRPKMGRWPVSKLPLEPLHTNPRDHALVGGNHWGIRAVMAANPERAVQYAGAFDLALARTLESLQAAVAVTLVDAPAAVAPGASFDVTVRVENLSGHKFPTGYADGRRAWIAIALVGEDSAERTLLGAYDAATGDVQSAPATRVYRAERGRWDGAQAVPELSLARQDMLLTDTRIPPKGFLATTITEPSGDVDFSDGQGGWRSFDEATFTVTAPADAYGVQTLSARVYYQSITRDYVEFLQAANTTTTAGDDLMAIYESTGEGAPILCASAEGMVDLGPDPNGTGGAGGDATGGGGMGGGGTAGAGGAEPPEEEDDGGCGCRAVGAGRTGTTTISAAAMLLMIAAGTRRRRQAVTPCEGVSSPRARLVRDVYPLSSSFTRRA